MGDVAGELDDGWVGDAGRRGPVEEGVVRQAFVMSATFKVKKRGQGKEEREKQGEDGKGKTGDGGGGGDNSLNMVKFARKLLRMPGKPRVIDVSDASRAVSSKIKQIMVRCPKENKDLYLLFFLLHNTGRTIVFVNHISVLRKVHGIIAMIFGPASVRPLHAAMQQRARLKSLDRFRESPSGVLIATDVAARGLDIASVHHVVHFDVPHNAEAYLHRSGRAAHVPGISCLIAKMNEFPPFMQFVFVLDFCRDYSRFKAPSTHHQPSSRN
jgi:superfamily II DNA or RNA helicase